MNIQQSKSTKHYDWVVMPDMYITSSLILVEKMLNYSSLSNQVHMGSEITKELNLRSYHSNYELVLPLVFNFKQGIELYIKAIGIMCYGTYLKSHDLKDLMKNLKNLGKNTKNKKTINKLIYDTWPTIKKYYYGRYISNKKSNFADKQNEAERYPEYKGRVLKSSKTKPKIYRIPDRFLWVTGQVVSEIHKDIKYIERKFSQAKRDIKPVKIFIYGRKNLK